MAFEKLMAFLGLDARQFKDELKKSEKEAAATGKGFERVLGEGAMKRIADSWSDPLLTLGKTFVTFLAFDQVSSLVQETIQWGRETSKAAENLGVSVKFLNGLDEAAERTSADIDEATKAITKLALKMSEARNGNEEAIKSFREWGIDIDGKSTEEVFLQMVKLRNASNEHAMFYDLMGKNYKDAMGIARLGVEGLNEEMRTANKLTEDQTEKLRKLSNLENKTREWAKMVMAEILTGGMQTVAPTGTTEEQIQARVKALAKEKGIDLGSLNKKSINSSGSWAYTANKESDYDRTQRELRDEAIAKIKKEQKEAADAAAKAVKDKEIADKIKKAKSDTAEIYKKSSLEGMTAEQKAAYYASERLKIEQQISTEKNPLKVAELEKQAAEFYALESGAKRADKSSTVKSPSPDLNAMQKIGAYTSQSIDKTAVQAQKQVQLTERVITVLERIEQKVTVAKDPSGGITYSTKF